MRRILTTLAVLAGLAVVPAGSATAASNNPTQCGSAGRLVVNVTYTLVNDYDSGVAGNAWANDTIDRHLQIRETGDGYCALVNDTGSFVTFEGASPSGAGTVEAGINGRIKGGYATDVFQGTLASEPAYATHGNLGVFDLECTSAYSCEGAHPSYLSYFGSTSGDEPATWSWAYHTARNGDWVNAAGGNSGDITG